MAWARGFVRREEQDFRRYQRTVFSGAYTITVLQYVYTWVILQFCGRSGPTGTFGNSVPPWHKTSTPGASAAVADVAALEAALAATGIVITVTSLKASSGALGKRKTSSPEYDVVLLEVC